MRDKLETLFLVVVTGSFVLAFLMTIGKLLELANNMQP